MSKFFQELKRRKVLKTLGVYGAAGIVTVQVAASVVPYILLPPSAVTFVIVLVILGFPITFFLSWTYDLKRDIIPDNKKDSVNVFMEHAHAAEQLQNENDDVETVKKTVKELAGDED